MKLRELFSEDQIKKLEFQDLIRNLSYEDFNRILENTEKPEDIDFYINLQDLIIQIKQEEMIENGVF